VLQHLAGQNVLPAIANTNNRGSITDI